MISAQPTKDSLLSFFITSDVLHSKTNILRDVIYFVYWEITNKLHMIVTSRSQQCLFQALMGHQKDRAAAVAVPGRSLHRAEDITQLPAHLGRVLTAETDG